MPGSWGCYGAAMVRARRALRQTLRWYVRAFFELSAQFDRALRRLGWHEDPSPILDRLNSWSHDPR
jgi:hypothetical protein